MKPLAIIPARGGSKGVPRKNIKKLAGKPLICYTIEAAREVFDDEIICISTDDEEIKSVAERTGLNVPFLRPSNLAQATTGMREVLLHALDHYRSRGYDADTVFLLQPTSPLRKARHIKEAMELYHSDVDRVVSVKESSSNPYYVLFEENEEGFLEQSKKGDFARRQDCPRVWELNGAVYVINVQSIVDNKDSSYKKSVKYEMDEESSIDIDSHLDWKVAEILISETQNVQG